MERYRLMVRFFRHWWRAQGRHGLHSPFVYALYERVIRADRQEDAFRAIEQLRGTLLQSREELEVTDLGAGSQHAATRTRQRSIRDLTRLVARSPRSGRLLYRLLVHWQPASVLELGTSLGLGAAYLAAAVPGARVHSVEGCPNIAARARQHHETLGLTNITVHTGDFQEKLPELLTAWTTLDVVFFDGNHRAAPTLAYFEQCLEKVGPQTVFIFDDIHWSAGMEQAWEKVIRHPKVTVSIDLFHLGLVFFREHQAKQHFRLRF
ncbi:MAG: class I SAM-dependent methyltransferase [Bacteroidota bacterium]